MVQNKIKFLIIAIPMVIAFIFLGPIQIATQQAAAVAPIPFPSSCKYVGHPTNPLSQTAIKIGADANGPIMWIAKHAEKEIYDCIISGQLEHYILDSTLYTTVLSNSTQLAVGESLQFHGNQTTTNTTVTITVIRATPDSLVIKAHTDALGSDACILSLGGTFNVQASLQPNPVPGSDFLILHTTDASNGIGGPTYTSVTGGNESAPSPLSTIGINATFSGGDPAHGCTAGSAADVAYTIPFGAGPGEFNQIKFLGTQPFGYDFFPPDGITISPTGTSTAFSQVICAKDPASGTVYSCDLHTVGSKLAKTSSCSQLALQFPQRMNTFGDEAGSATSVETQKEIFRCNTANGSVMQEVVIWTVQTDNELTGASITSYQTVICQKPATSIQNVPTMSCQASGFSPIVS